MSVMNCTHCGKRLRVPDEAAGKKARCPHCGQTVIVSHKDATLPSHSKAAPGLPEDRTLPPQASAAAGMPRPPRDRAQAGTESVSDADDRTSGASGAGSNPQLTEFLAPPQAPDELGRLGPYRVFKVLGAGGMGVVFKAEDPLLKRPVALKAMLPGLVASGTAKQRFLREAQASAALKHDHIVTIFQVGEDRGAPFLAMEFLEGEPLDDRLKREGKLPLPEVLRIGREMAEALDAAHEKGLIHRDIKPANVWLEKLPGSRSGSSPRIRVKILDFGLARAATEEAHLTQSGAIVGTPAYMAPEQAQGKELSPRSDLFSLGCVLYRMCTGQAPFQAADAISTLVVVATEDPLDPHAIDPEVPPALSDLVMRLLAKKPKDRPASAREVADALEALATAPVRVAVVRKPQAVVRPHRQAPVATAVLPRRAKVARPQPRHRTLIIAGTGAGVAALVLLTTVVILLSRPGNDSTPPIDTVTPQNGRENQVEIQPLDLPPGAPLSELAVVRQPAAVAGTRSWTLITRSHVGAVLALAFSPDGKLLASGGHDGHVRLWDPDTGQLVRALVGHGLRGVSSLAWSLDGHYLASAGADNTVRIWQVKRGMPVRTLNTPVPQFTPPAWLAKGTLLAFQLQVWDARTGRKTRSLTLDGDVDDLRSAVWSANGKRVATGHGRPTDQVWDANSGKLLKLLPETGSGVGWAPDNKTLVSWFLPGRPDFRIRLWDTYSGELVHLLEGHTNVVMSVAWKPDGSLLASGSLGDRVVRIWDARSGKQVGILPGHYVDVDAVAWSPDGKTVASGDPQGTVRLWHVQSQKEIHSLEGLGFFVSANEDARIPLRDNLGLEVSPEGHYRCPPWLEREVLYVVQTDQGQETLVPGEFSQRYKWKNDPERARQPGK
jgi:serine/threonine protein kinase/WD40 repeat protein